MSAWINKNILESIPIIYPATSGKLLPQELLLDEHGAISYDKGCYTGQEIIARMHYRGKAKSTLYQAKIISEQVIQPGNLIYTHSTEPSRECGIVIEAGDNTNSLLISLNIADATDKNLFIHHTSDHLIIQTEENHG